MKNVVGIFERRADAENAAARLIELGFVRENVSLLTPGATEGEIARVKTSDTEESGTGAAIGGVVGAAAGASAGVALVSFVPGLGPVLAAGWAAIALLGIFGAVGGGVAGEELEESLSEGLPKDDLFLYEDALRKGHSIVIALSDDDQRIDAGRAAFRAAGAEDVDTARERWWIGMRGKDEQYQEPEYRHGVEAALHPECRGKRFDDAASRLSERIGPSCRTDAFRRGYERGRSYYEQQIGHRHD
jgi:hypothetical protein